MIASFFLHHTSSLRQREFTRPRPSVVAQRLGHDASILIDNGNKVEKPKGSTDYDRLVNDKKIEIKGSLGWVTNGKITHYRFQQIIFLHVSKFL